MKRLIPIVMWLALAGVASAQSLALPMQQSNAAEGYHVFQGTQLVTLTVNWNAATSARYLMIFDSTSATNANATTTRCQATQTDGCLLYCSYVANSATAPNLNTWNFASSPLVARNGIIAALSTGAGCGSFTADGSNDFFYAQVR